MGFTSYSYSELKVSTDVLVEFVDQQFHASTQTEQTKHDDTNTPIEMSNFDGLLQYRGLDIFIRRVGSLFLKQLDENLNTSLKSDSSLLLYNSNRGESGANTIDEDFTLTYWRMLSVDLEKRKVVFPDWTQQAKHYPAVVQRCVLTRNKERVYDIEYDDGSKLTSVREEYIRLLGSSTSTSVASKMASKLQEGVRVHAKVTFKGGVVKHLPGRVMKCYRSSSSGGGGVYDVECEGSRLEKGLTLDSLIIGLTGNSAFQNFKHHYTTFVRGTAS